MTEVAEVALVYHYGDTFSGKSWQWKGSDGVDKDITGYLASMKVRTDEGAEVLSLSSPSGGLTIPTGTDGKVVLNVTPAIMTAGQLVEGVTYVYDIQVKSPDGTIVKTLTKGPFRVDTQVTDV